MKTLKTETSQKIIVISCYSHIIPSKPIERYDAGNNWFVAELSLASKN